MRERLRELIDALLNRSWGDEEAEGDGTPDDPSMVRMSRNVTSPDLPEALHEQEELFVTLETLMRRRAMVVARNNEHDSSH